MTTAATADHPIVSREQWIKARVAHLAEEKRLLRELDELRRQRRALPWVKIDKPYTFDTPQGQRSLLELFDGRSQLIVYHFMFGPGWTEGCTGCSFIADHIDGANLHLANRDVTLLAVSRAPRSEFEPFKKRMGWTFQWVSSHGSDFNYDFHVSCREGQPSEYNYRPINGNGGEHHGASVFIRNDAGEVFHTYSTYARGCESLIGAFQYLDLTPLGRNETSTMNWVRHHDRYENARGAEPCCASPESCCSS